MRRIIGILFLTALLGIFAAGCGNVTGSEFIGKWVNSERDAETIEIKRNGESFIVTRSTPTIVDKIVKNGEKKTTEHPAIFKDKVLTVNMGSEPITISHIKDGNYLQVGGHKFIRQK